MSTGNEATRRRAARKPKYKIGQVVAIFDMTGHVPDYYRIASFYFDNEDKLRYTFAADKGDTRTAALSPIEEILRPLNKSEAGR